MNDESRPAPSWAGDVHAGVDAWTRGASQDSTPDPRPSRGGSTRRGSGRRRSSAAAPEDTAAGVPEADPESVARTILLDQLTGRARSRKELTDKLASKNVPTEIGERLLDRFEELGLVDDEAFARTWVEQRGAGGPGRGLARRALAQELRRKGIDDEVAREVLDEVDPDDETDTARLLVRKKLRTLTGVDDITATRRLVGMLARKGYGSGMAYAVVREELRARGRDGLDDEITAL